MKYIDAGKILTLLDKGRRLSARQLDAILAKSKALKRLTLEETAALLNVCDAQGTRKIFEAASYVKNAIYGSRIVLFAPLYISNVCANACLYCAFKADNPYVHRRVLTPTEIKEEVRCLLEKGHKRILMVAGEGAQHEANVDYYVEGIQAIYAAQTGPHRIKRVNVNCAPLSVAEFKKLKVAGIGTYQLFQETYHDATYRTVHPKGPKSDPDNRLDALDRAFIAGIDDVGVGVLYGLYDHKFETLALLSHIEHLEKKFNVGPHTISVPRLEPAIGVDFVNHLEYKVSDNDFKRVVAILRLAVPYTGLILSTRETAALRDELFDLGVSQVSAESKTSPGGYRAGKYEEDGKDAQFYLGDKRSLDEVIGSLLKKGFLPSFCAACYRKERTGEAFMDLAKPGTIKGKCCVNALITLKEYCDDFASEGVKKTGYQAIEKARAGLDEKTRAQLCRFFADIKNGVRDEYV